jgi:Flp pilus assembly protein TadD
LIQLLNSVLISAPKSLIISEKYTMSPSRLAMLVMASTLWGALTVPVAIAQTTPLPAKAQNNEYQDATLLFRQGQIERALEKVDAWLKARPKDARGRFLRGMILTQQKKTDEAIRTYIDLTQDFPELPEPYNNLAVIYASQGEYDKARVLLETAVRALPSFAAAHENLGDIYARLAAVSYERAIKLDTANKTAAAKLKAVNDLLPGGKR